MAGLVSFADAINTPLPMDSLTLPAYTFERRSIDGKPHIYDAVREQYVRLTPEEWVRQHLLRYLMEDRGVPRALLAVEQAFAYQQQQRRADAVVHNSAGEPLLVVECKAPRVKIDQGVFDQLARYNQALDARFLAASNGRTHYCCRFSEETGAFQFMESIPPFEALRAAGPLRSSRS